jgi:hypothetical protein
MHTHDTAVPYEDLDSWPIAHLHLFPLAFHYCPPARAATISHCTTQPVRYLFTFWPLISPPLCCRLPLVVCSYHPCSSYHPSSPLSHFSHYIFALPRLSPLSALLRHLCLWSPLALPSSVLRFFWLNTLYLFSQNTIVLLF